MPRSFNMTCDRFLSDKVTPGNRVKIVGILSVRSKTEGGGASEGGKNVKQIYIRVVGIMSEINKDGSMNTSGFAQPNINEDDIEKIKNFAKDPNIFNKISKSIASAIYG